MKRLLILILGIIALLQYACKKDSNGGGQPVITGIRSIDSLKRDSMFTQAVPGTLIVIEGDNLGGAQAVFFNDTSAYFNPVYNTGSNIIVTIPGTAQTAATDPNVTNQIRVVTDHGEATFSFTLYLYPPYISSISFDNSGSLVYIKGNNFQGVQKITFPLTGGGPDTALSYEVNKEYTLITAEIPPGIAYKDSLRVYCTFGENAYSYPPPMSIAAISNENAVEGSTLNLLGTNFVGIQKVIFPGGLEGSNIVTRSVNEFSVTVPAGITMQDSLRVQGALGTATAPFLFDSYIAHPSPGYLSTFEVQYASDNTGFVGWTGGYAPPETAPTTYPGSSGGAAMLVQGAPMGPNAGPTSQGNPGLLQLNSVPWVANTAQSIDGYYMKFEMYAVTPWSKGQIWISLGDWYQWSSYTARFAPYELSPSGVYNFPVWTTITIPLSSFITGNEFYKTTWSTTGSPAKTFSDYPATSVVFMIANDKAEDVPANSINVAIDNVRIVKGN